MIIELNEKEMLLIDSIIRREIDTYNEVLKHDNKNICKTIKEDKETYINILKKLWG